METSAYVPPAPSTDSMHSNAQGWRDGRDLGLANPPFHSMGMLFPSLGSQASEGSVAMGWAPLYYGPFTTHVSALK